MIVRQDYRKCVSMSLNIMRNQRESIFNDTIEHYSAIYNGLHEFHSVKTRELYFQAYIIEWTDKHWLLLNEYMIKHKNDMMKNEQRDMTMFFADFFSFFLDEIGDRRSFSCETMHEMIKVKQSAINEMIRYSDKWEEKNNKLQVELKKNKEQFERMLTKLTEDVNDG